MNWQHFRAFVWLRWRLRINQIKKGGTAGAVILAILAALTALLSVSLFVTFFAVGLFVLGDVEPVVLLFVWDGLVVAFLFSWAIGLMVELQRAEALSLQKFLHLPVALSSAFLINYISSLFNFTVVAFVPAMIGLCLGLAGSRGPAELLVLPVVAAFVLMISAVTYQFQGWLATLMSNPRRRRTVIVVATMVLVLLTQLPNLLNIVGPWRGEGRRSEARTELLERQAELRRQLTAKEITPEQFQQRDDRLQREYKAESEARGRQTLQRVEEVFGIANLVVPPGWLALAGRGVAAGDFLPALLAFCGLGAVGAGSLWRSYRTTVRYYRGEFTAGKRRAAPAAAGARPRPAVPRLLEARLPFVSEQAAAVTLATLRGLMRAPEAKMMLLAPMILAVVFGGMFLSGAWNMPEALRPLAAFGALSMVLLSLVQFAGNQFGFDRSGFRTFVLCGAPRRDILLGKNLGLAPVAWVLCAVLVTLLQVAAPMRADYLIALAPLALSMYLLFCLLANAMSILAPLPVPPGALKPRSTKGFALLWQFVFLFSFPTVMGLTLWPLAVELLLQFVGWGAGLPVYLLLNVVQCAAVVCLYLWVLRWQGRWLQAREQDIVGVVTQKAE